MADFNLDDLGPLKALAGDWKGDMGDDTAPADDRTVEKNAFYEVVKLEAFGPVNNHEQTMFGLRHSKVATRFGADAPFHEETGYWLYDKDRSLVMRCVLVPRGIAIIAGGVVANDAKSFTLTAEIGSPTFGIISNPFLDAEFRTVRYEVKVEVLADGRITTEEDTTMLMKGRKDLFHHIDKNTLKRV